MTDNETCEQWQMVTARTVREVPHNLGPYIKVWDVEILDRQGYEMPREADKDAE